MTAETSNARGEWPERYACNGPEGTFWTDDAALANKLIGAAFDRDEWTVTDTQNPTGAAPSSTAETSNVREWVLVPREPTAEMVQASDEISCRAEGAEHWAAMLAAAPPPAAAEVVATNSAVSAIQFALKDPEGMTFLRLWNEGEFDTLRREWPDAPVEIYIDADPLAAAQQPAGVDEAYPTPRNRAEAAALARLALAHLGVIDAHIDAAIARCETNSAAQAGGVE